MKRSVSATQIANITGTARRSASRTARGPAATTAVVSAPTAIAQPRYEPPATRTQADAAIRLLTAIQAKLLAYMASEMSAAPRTPSAARAAITDGTPSRGPRGAKAATSAAPAAQ